MTRSYFQSNCNVKIVIYYLRYPFPINLGIASFYCADKNNTTSSTRKVTPTFECEPHPTIIVHAATERSGHNSFVSFHPSYSFVIIPSFINFSAQLKMNIAMINTSKFDKLSFPRCLVSFTFTDVGLFY